MVLMGTGGAREFGGRGERRKGDRWTRENDIYFAVYNNVLQQLDPNQTKHRNSRPLSSHSTPVSLLPSCPSHVPNLTLRILPYFFPRTQIAVVASSDRRGVWTRSRGKTTATVAAVATITA